jgi:hypothetical protein
MGISLINMAFWGAGGICKDWCPNIGQMAFEARLKPI